MKNIEIYSSIYLINSLFIWGNWPSTSLQQIIYAGPGGTIMNKQLTNILDNNKWFYRGTTILGRAANGTSRWLNEYWYHYRGTFENSDIFFDDESTVTKVMWFQIWSHRDDAYVDIGILPTGEFIKFTGSNSNRPWGMAPGTSINCNSYTVRSIQELVQALGLNGYELMELIALRCACY